MRTSYHIRIVRDYGIAIYEIYARKHDFYVIHKLNISWFAVISRGKNRFKSNGSNVRAEQKNRHYAKRL